MFFFLLGLKFLERHPANQFDRCDLCLAADIRSQNGDDIVRHFYRKQTIITSTRRSAFLHQFYSKLPFIIIYGKSHLFFFFFTQIGKLTMVNSPQKSIYEYTLRGGWLFQCMKLGYDYFVLHYRIGRRN